MAKELRETVKTGLSTVLANPLLLLILLIIGLIVLGVAVGIIIYYGLATAIILFVLTMGGVLLLHSLKAVDLQKQPTLAFLPFIMAGIGYVGERLRLFSVQPSWASLPEAQVTLEPAHVQLLALIVALMIIVALAAGRTR